MVARRPVPDGEAGGLERLRYVVGEAGLEVDDLDSWMEAGSVNGIAV